MLLSQEVGDGVDVLSVHGHVAGADARELVDAVDSALHRRPRGVVLDLRDVTGLESEAADALRALVDGAGTRHTPGSPAPALLLCTVPAEVERALDLPVHASREQALASLDVPSPVRSVVPIEHSVHGPAQARRVVADCVERLGLAETGHDLVLLVSELVTNAVRYGAPPVRLEVDVDDDSVVVGVGDASPSALRRRAAGDDAEGGRGLALVDLLADEHGVRPSPPGKTVWAAVRRSP